MPEQYDKKSLKLLGITARLQMLMINQNITPLELVNCAIAARSAWLMTNGGEKLELTGVLYCDFCNRDSNEKGVTLIAGPRNTHICSECVDVCRDVFEKKRGGGA
ncbi:ClpX C4-type zinc finger protein [Yokenella regensburgei]|uniref:ClpX C4-type zinc finger protein n=1 Tax=Yokenella regensburgei TaxID=158877 RepID=UPI001375F506|nr:ClpX C4-type zinc finger protein [Yokenella regensburgei]KAF1367147.1 hypothetical protein FHR25_004362 [Yokenella regensburgei]